MDLKETDILGDDIRSHWYYQSKAKAVSRLLSGVQPSIILDVGAGSGFFSRKLLSDSSAKEAWCVDISYEGDSDEVEAGKPVHLRRSIGSVNADLVLLMDVLEHVDDDVGLLKHYMEKVPNGARFLITVPAFQFLWGDHDIFLEHKRRYSLNQMESAINRAGLTLKKSAYYFGAVFPIAAIIRLVKNLGGDGGRKAQSQLSLHHPVINGMLAAMSAAELPLLAYNRLAGLTVFCVAEKP